MSARRRLAANLCVAALILGGGAALGPAHADVVFHVFPRGAGVGPKLRQGIAAVVRAHVAAAGHKLGKRRAAAWRLSTRVRNEGGRYVVDVRYRRATEKDAREAIGVAPRFVLLATLGDLLQKVLPRTGDLGELPALQPGPDAPEPDAPSPDAPGATGSVSVVKTDEGKIALSTWVEDQPRWGDVYAPQKKLAPFPPATDPPPRLGEIPR